MAAHTAPHPATAPPAGFPRLRRANLALGVLHLLQAAVVLALTNDFSLPVTIGVPDGPPGPDAPPRDLLFRLPIGPAVAAFLALAAVDHLAVAAPRISRWYEHNLRRERNLVRWAEYSLSASLMLVLIAMLAGVADGVALLGIFTLSAAMIGFGLLMETVNPTRERPNWTPYAFGAIAGAVPWVAIALVLAAAEADGDVPGFVYGIFASLFVLYNAFAVNQWLQYRRIGPWRDYAYGEGAYLVLSLVAKSLLAWQIFSATLMD